MKNIAACLMALLPLALSSFDCNAAAAPLGQLEEEKLPYCGSQYAPPHANPTDGRKTRPCGPPKTRSYQAKHKGIGFKALELETESCFVPDEAYRLLDDIIDEVIRTVAQDTGAMPGDPSNYVLKVSAATGNVLAKRGFGLYIPTETLGDALVPRSAAGEPPRHVVDCDASSFILLSVADAMKLKANLVEITLYSGAGHNFVRWQIDQDTTLDWDTNGRSQCLMRANNPAFQGMSMTEDQVMSYLLTLRAQKWSQQGYSYRSVEDNYAAINKFPEHPSAYNNLVWEIATKVFPERSDWKDRALEYSRKLLEIERIPNNLDTAACMAAYAGDFVKAKALEEEALAGSPSNETFRRRAAQFGSGQPRDCTGE